MRPATRRDHRGRLSQLLTLPLVAGVAWLLVATPVGATAWTAEPPITTPAEDAQQVAVTAAGTKVVVAYIDKASSTIRFRINTAGGWSLPRTVRPTADLLGPSPFAVATDGSVVEVASTIDRGGVAVVEYRQVTLGGQLLHRADLPGGAVDPIDQPGIARASDGTTVVMHSAANGSLRTWQISGGVASPPTTLEAKLNNTASVARDSTGGLIAVWTHSNPGYKATLRWAHFASGTWTSPSALPAPDAQAGVHAYQLADNGGQTLLGWVHAPDHSIRALSYSAAGWGAEQTVSLTGGQINSPLSVTVDSGGQGALTTLIHAYTLPAGSTTWTAQPNTPRPPVYCDHTGPLPAFVNGHLTIAISVPQTGSSSLCQIDQYSL